MSAAKSSSATGTTGIADPFSATAPADAGAAGQGPRPARYVGRFAPTPSGPLHFGSLVAAVGSFLDARAAGGDWLVRIEDLDTPRVRAGAEDWILRDLEAHGLHWDGPVLRQSTRGEAYAAAIASLESRGLIRRCACSRAALAALAESQPSASSDELFHPPDCLVPITAASDEYALRFRCPDRSVQFVDRAQGAQAGNVARTVGDFVLRRRDGLYAYQIAVVVDDASQGITDVVRGADLLASTPRQLLLQQALGLPSPRYLHLPLAVDDRGLKLSKSENAPAARRATPAARIASVLDFLGQAPPDGLGDARLDEVWRWAIAHWRPERFAGVRSRMLESSGMQAGVQELTR